VCGVRELFLRLDCMGGDGVRADHVSVNGVGEDDVRVGRV